MTKNEKVAFQAELLKVKEVIDDLLRRLDTYETTDSLFEDLYGEKTLEDKTEFWLKKMGLPDYLSGYDCLKDAILLAAREKVFPNVTEVYRAVGIQYGKSHMAVERNIRFAIDYIFAQGDQEFLEKNCQFPRSSKNHKRHITNKEFIKFLTKKIQNVGN